MSKEFEKYWNSLATDFSESEELLNHCEHAAKNAYQAATEASDAKWQARVEGTTGYKYKSELYEEMWTKARAMGFPNVITALESITASQALVKELEEFIGDIKVWFSTETLIGKGLHDKCITISTTSPDQALQRRVLEARIDEALRIRSPDAWQIARLTELRKQLEEIGG